MEDNVCIGTSQIAVFQITSSFVFAFFFCVYLFIYLFVCLFVFYDISLPPQAQQRLMNAVAARCVTAPTSASLRTTTCSAPVTGIAPSGYARPPLRRPLSGSKYLSLVSSCTYFSQTNICAHWRVFGFLPFGDVGKSWSFLTNHFICPWRKTLACESFPFTEVRMFVVQYVVRILNKKREKARN